MPLRCQRKPSRRSARDLNLADSDVDVPRLIAVSGANVSSVDRHHDLGRALVSRLEFWQRCGLEIGGGTVRSVAHGCVIHRPTRQKCFQELGRLAIRMPSAQLCLKAPELRRTSVRQQFRQRRPRDIHEGWGPAVHGQFAGGRLRLVVVIGRALQQGDWFFFVNQN
jgi:hypothetical protein